MNLTELLAEDIRNKWLILDFIEQHNQSYCSMQLMIGTFGLSPYRTINYINQINQDFNRIGKATLVKILNNGEIHARNLTQLDLENIKIYYIKGSDQFNLLHHFFIEESSIKTQMSKLHLSKSVIYVQYKHLKTFLASEGLELKQNKIVGDELELRTIIFSIYYELFHGLKTHFPKEIENMASKIVNWMTGYFQLSIPKTTCIKIICFIETWLVRLKNNHFINQSYVVHNSSAFTRWISEYLTDSFTIPPEKLYHEIAYLIMFLHFEIDITPFNCIFSDSAMTHSAEKMTSIFIGKFQDELDDHLLKAINYSHLAEELLKINQKYLIYHYQIPIFFKNNHKEYFRERFPCLDIVIRDFVYSENLAKFFRCTAEKEKLYFEYLFLLLNILPMKQIEEPLYVCIDFSLGKNYNQYIESILNSMKAMNICYESRISAKTDLFLSDCALDKITCRQLIWKHPPTMNDWRALIQLFIKIKGNFR